MVFQNRNKYSQFNVAKLKTIL
ncbi:MAG: hypothetical protein AB7E39_06510 [Endomicrobiaceae bacterium]